MTGRPTQSHADVLIIGAGPAGGSAARRLVNAGMSVVCLEQGHWPDRMAFPGSGPYWEIARRKQWSWEPNIRQRPEDYSIDLGDCDPGSTLMNFNGVGGSTTLFAAIWPRFTPSNFRTRSLHGFADDWPLTYEELLPYYEETDREVGVSGLGGNPAYPSGEDPPLPPLPIQPGGLHMARAYTRLGWHWWPDSNAILSSAYDGRNVCVQRGTCSSGCSEGAKGSADLAFWRHVVAAGGHLITGARVRRLVLDSGGLVAGAEWVDRDGVEHFQGADVTLCAANGIGTPRLLLASACPSHPDGLANGSGLVGRNLMFHPQAGVTGAFEERFGSWQGHAGSWVGSWEFYESDERRGFVGSAKWQLGHTGGPLGHVLPSPRSATWGQEHHRRLAKRLGRSLSQAVTGEELPLEENRIELSTDRSDSDGIAIPKLFYRISENSWQMMAWHCGRLGELMTEAGAIDIETVPMVPHFGHLMGTTRMGNEPGRSVVNRWGVTHQIPNLAVLDGSVFVTSAGVNPTSTICALARRTADYLVQHRSEVPTPSRPRIVPSARWGVDPAVPPEREPVGATDDIAVQDQHAPNDPLLSAQDRQSLIRLADVLIPASGSHPAPSKVGIGDQLLDRVMTCRPDLIDDLRRGLASVPESNLSSWFQTLQTVDSGAHGALSLAIAGGYYLSPEVQRVISYPGQIAMPVRADIYPQYVDEGLLDLVLSRSGRESAERSEVRRKGADC